MELINGKKIAQEILAQLKEEVAALSFVPVFCDVLVGNDSVSEQYVTMKERRAHDSGIKVRKARFPEDITTAELVQEIQRLNEIEHMCGLIVQLPLPSHVDTQKVLNAIDPRIDVDVLGQESAGAFYQGDSNLSFPTALAIMHILESLPVELSNKKFVILGQGKLVGKPILRLVQEKGWQARAFDGQSNEQEMREALLDADVVISATGKGHLIEAQNIKKGVIVIDAGTSESGAGVIGDVDSDSVANRADFLSPVPGGVGPVTVAMLLKNVVQVAKRQ